MKRSLWVWFEPLQVLLPGALGMVVVARTLASYWGRDRLATGIVAAMAGALALGLLDLLLRQRRAILLQRELGALTHHPSEATVDAASPLLSSLLRARLDQAPAPHLSESLAPSLTGLLVMLGLLGTLLGLFETVQGASRALSLSSDLEALRRGLTQPIDGLTRSFGCSAAGISASAMLGLAVALVRRREGRTLRALHQYAAGPLRVLSPARRQLRALEQLAAQAAAAPDTRGGLEKVGLQLGDVVKQLGAMHTSSLAEQQRAVTELLSGVRSELGGLVEGVSRAIETSVGTRLGEVTAQVLSAQAEQVRSFGESARTLAAELEASAQAGRSHASELVLLLDGRLASEDAKRQEAQRAAFGALHELAERLLEQTDRQSREQDARHSELAARLDGTLAALREGDQRRTTQVEALTGELSQRLGQLSDQLGREAEQARAGEQAQHERASEVMQQLERSGASIESAWSRQERALGELAERQSAWLSRLAEESQRGHADALAQLTAQTSERLTELYRSEEQRRVQLAALTEAGVRGQEQALAQLGAQTAERLAELAALAETSLRGQEQARVQQSGESAERLAQLGALVEASVRGQEQALAQLAAQTTERLGELAQRSEERLAQLSSRLGDELTQRSAHEQAAEQRAQRSMEQLGQTADALSSLWRQTLARQEETVLGLREQLPPLFATMAAATSEATRDTLERLTTSTDERLAQLASLAEANARAQEQATGRLSAESAERLAQLGALVEASVRGQEQALAQLAAQTTERLGELAQRSEERLAQLSSRLGDELTQRSAHEQAAEQRAQRSMEQLGQTADALSSLWRQTLARQEETVLGLREQLPPLFATMAAATSETTRDTLERLTTSTDERLAQLSALLQRELEQRIASEQTHAAQAQTAMAGLEQTAALLESEIARQREVTEALAQRLGALFGQLGDSLRETATRTLSDLRRESTGQAEQLAKLEQALESARGTQAQALGEQLARQAEQLEGRLSQVTGVVQEAATLWKVSSIEMQVVADSFAQSVERQREASDAWLESLGEIELAVDKAGRHAAADALSDQLASTQEVFARQLQFQRELFEQLRSLRAASRSHEEQDVSV